MDTGCSSITELYLLVEWVDYDSVVRAKQVLHHSPEFLECGDVVEVKEGTAKHKATVVASGMLYCYIALFAWVLAKIQAA